MKSEESGINLWTHRTRGRSKIGTPAVRQVNFHRWKNVTLLLAISETDGVIESKFNLGGTKSADFNDFLSSLSTKLSAIHPNQRFCFIVDNAPIHTHSICQMICTK